MSFPIVRPRRLRQNPMLREMLAQTTLHKEHLIYPLFIKEGLIKKSPIASMPGVFQYSLKEIGALAQELEASGIAAVILFGIPETKDAKASQAYHPQGIVQKAIKAIKEKTKKLIVITDVCLCEYTSHAHCGVIPNLKSPVVDNDETLKLLAKVALSHAQAGADIVAPSDMMDGRVSVLRAALDTAGYTNTPIMSYAVKYASSLYGPFRDAAENTPQAGDRKSYQMDYRNRDEALREADLDQAEGADFLIVKPASLYLDIIQNTKSITDLPIIAYQVSGEYSMIKAAAQNGWIDEKGVVLESLIAMRRAGAQLIITYFARDVLNWL